MLLLALLLLSSIFARGPFTALTECSCLHHVPLVPLAPHLRKQPADACWQCQNHPLQLDFLPPRRPGQQLSSPCSAQTECLAGGCWH